MERFLFWVVVALWFLVPAAVIHDIGYGIGYKAGQDNGYAQGQDDAFDAAGWNYKL